MTIAAKCLAIGCSRLTKKPGGFCWQHWDMGQPSTTAPTEQTEAQDDGAADTRNLRATVDSCANPPEIPDSSIDSPYAKWPRSRIHDVMDALRCITDWAYKNGHGEVGYEPEEVLRVWLINAWVDLESARSAMTVMVKERDACCDETRSAVRQVFADAEQVKALRADLAQKMQEHQDALSEMRGRMESARGHIIWLVHYAKSTGPVGEGKSIVDAAQQFLSPPSAGAV